MRPKAIFGVLPLVLITALIGCGGSKSDDASGEKANAPDAKELLQQTFGPNEKASSGTLSGTVNINVKGAPRYREPIRITLNGPFAQSGGGAPEANLSVALARGGSPLGGELILVDEEVLIGLGTTGYRVPGDIAATIRRPLANSDNALASVLAVFGIAPQRWAKNPRVVGEEKIAGVNTFHVAAQIGAQRFFLDVARLTKILTKLRITEVTGLPREVDRKARIALAGSMTSASGDIWTGAEDKVLRKASFDMKLKPSDKDRRTLGFTSMTVDGELTVTDIGRPQRIEAPPSRGSYDALQITLDALAESAQ